ncbi:MAG: hypothetical protein B6I32_08905 [Desulfobacterium sp. 4572_20]|nr:MAG: hypothetical protein B6I32_08905 [Desulfobacterium sp. 4572_20]
MKIHELIWPEDRIDHIRHDLTDFEDELEEVSDPVFERAPVMKIRLLPDEAEAVKQLAKSKGIPYPDLIREWVREKIQA